MFTGFLDVLYTDASTDRQMQAIYIACPRQFDCHLDAPEIDSIDSDLKSIYSYWPFQSE